MNCPKCCHPCDRDEVAILTGTLYGPWVCKCCGWSDDPQRDWSMGVPSAAVSIDDYLMRKMRGDMTEFNWQNNEKEKRR